MGKKLCVTAALICAGVGLIDSTRAFQAAPPAPRVSTTADDNAADLYGQAFALQPTDADAAAFDKMSSAPGPLTEEARALLGRYDVPAKLVRKAFSATKCDWKLDRTKGPLLAPLPFLGPARRVAQLMTLRARAAAEQNDFTEAMNETAALVALGRRIGQEPLILCKLIEYGIVGQAAQEAGKWVNGVPVQTAQAFAIMLTVSLPQSTPPAEALVAENNAIADWLATPQNADPERLFGKQGAFAPQGEWTEAAERQSAELKAIWADAAARNREIAAIREISEAAGKVISASQAEVKAANDAWWKKLQAAGPVAKLVAGGKPTTLRTVAAMSDLSFGMFRTALAIRINGPTALAGTHDPYGDGPFEREDLPDGGYVLKSKFTSRDGPVQLKVGK